MRRASWKVDDQEQAVYIDCDDEPASTVDEKREFSHWANLPDLILEKIFSYLTIRERYYASMVCRRWNAAFYLPYVWSTFVLEDLTLTRRKFNYYMGWQHVLDHFRTQICLQNVGQNFKKLVFEPMYNFYNLYEFMTMLSYFVEGESGTAKKVHTLRFTFSCNMASREEQAVYGTGGTLLQALKRLMGGLITLRRLELIDLLLDSREAQHLLDEVCNICCQTLHTLVLINATKMQYQLLHAGVFLNLQVLVISPQNLGEDLVELLGYTSLRDMHIVQNRYTTEARPVSSKAWKQCRLDNPCLRVHLEAVGLRNQEVLWQERAPVKSIIYDSAYSQIKTDSILTLIDLYKADLEVYGYKGLPRFYRPKSFHDRADSLLLLLCRQCPYIHTLVVRERVSTATALLIAYTAKNLRYLYVRRNALILRSDWPHSPEWSDEFYRWLSTSARSYEAMEREISQILGYRWTALSDRQFKLTELNLHRSPYIYN